MSKFLNTTLFAKKLEFLYREGNKTIKLNPLKPLQDHDGIDFKQKIIEIEILITHTGA